MTASVILEVLLFSSRRLSAFASEDLTALLTPEVLLFNPVRVSTVAVSKGFTANAANAEQSCTTLHRCF